MTQPKPELPEPCPMCGRSVAVKIRRTRSEPRQYVVVCDASTRNRLGGCGCSCGYQTSRAAAVAAWNTRAAAPQPEARDGERSSGSVQAEGVMFGAMDSANFEADTVTFRMEPGYYAAAGRYRIAPHPLAQGGGNER